MRSTRLRADEVVGALIIPTGIGAAIGGHAGDATPVAKMLASCCDWLIVHPNVVNASDINEMPENALYVDGFTLDQFMLGHEGLKRCRRQNKILVVANDPIHGATLNTVNAARITIGADIQVVGLKTPLLMTATKNESGAATGIVTGVDELVAQIQDIEYDTLAIHTPIICDTDVELDYWANGGVNPWGGIEAKVSRMISKAIRKPVAHAPLDIQDKPEFRNLYCAPIDKRMSPEAVSTCFFHCVLKGLHDCPTPTFLNQADWTQRDLDFIVVPEGAYSMASLEAVDRGSKMIQVEENTTVLKKKERISESIYVPSYLEAAGIVSCMRAGVSPDSVRAD